MAFHLPCYRRRWRRASFGPLPPWSLIDGRCFVDWSHAEEDEDCHEQFWLQPSLDRSVGGGLRVLLFVVVMCRGDVYVENKYESSTKGKDFLSSKDPLEDSISFLYCSSCT